MRFDRRTRTGTIVGVIGGYEQGGGTGSVSYTAYLGAAIQRLYREAVADHGATRPTRPVPRATIYVRRQ
jgi:hypothetical protein